MLLDKIKKKNYTCLFIIAMLLCVALFYGQGLFTNATTPAGDAKRIKTYVNTFNLLEEKLPLWVPNKNCGTPLLADSEQIFYFFLTPVLSIGGDNYYNLNLNLLILFFLCIFATAVYSLLRSLDVSKFASCTGGILATCSGTIYINYLSGRMNGLLFLSCAIFLLPVYKQFIDKKKFGAFVVFSALIGLQTILSGYYVLLSMVMVGAFAIGLYIEKGYDFLSAFIHTILNLAGASVCGLGLFAFVLVPLTIFQLDFLVHSGYENFLKVPDKGTLINFFLPLIASGKEAAKQIVFPHISILLLPGLIVLFFQRMWKEKASLWTLVIIGFSFLLIAESFFLPSVVFKKIYSLVPFLRDIRHSLAYTYFAGFLLLVGAIYAIDRPAKLKSNHVYLFCAIVFAGLVFFFSDWLGVFYGEQKEGFINYNWTIVGYLGIIFSTIFLFFKLGHYKWFRVNLLILMILFQMIVPEWSALGDKRTDNKTFLSKELKSQAGKFNHSRLLSNPNLCQPPGWEDQSNVAGFSMYFSPYYRNALSYLFNKPILEQRPNWINSGFSSVTEEGVEMFNVKHALYKEKEKPSNSEWEKVAINEGYVLWKHISHNNHARGIKVFDNWQVTGNKDIKINNVRKAWHNDIIMLDSNPDIAKHDNKKLEYDLEVLNYTPSKIKLHITTSKPVVVFLSEIYAEAWKAQVNGKDVPVLKAYQAFRAIPVPKGESELTLSYCLWEFYIGIFISILTIVFLIITIMIRNRRNIR